MELCLELCHTNWLNINPLKCKLEVASRMLLGELSTRMTSVFGSSKIITLLNALSKWHHCVQAKPTKVYSDKISLKYFQSQLKLPPKQVRLQGFLVEFDTEIVHKARRNNAMTDALSRLNTISLLEHGALVEQIKQAQSEDLDIKRFLVEFCMVRTILGLFAHKEGVFYAHERIYVPTTQL